MSPAWRTAVRRGRVLLVLGVVCLALSLLAIENLHSLLVALGTMFVVLGLIVVVATGRTLSASGPGSRVAAGSSAGRPAEPPPEG